MTIQKRYATATTFFEHLKLALEHCHEPLALGRFSPLAAPYFLGSVLHDQATDEAARGQVLAAELFKALQTLWGGPLPARGPEMLRIVDAAEAAGARGAHYDCLILELNYFQRCFDPPPRNQAEIYDDILHISRSTHDRSLREATAKLGAILLKRLRPSLRAETPERSNRLIGRASLQAQALQALVAGKSVALTGPGGIGKTALGGWLFENWITLATFWFTVRPTLNDNLNSFLFALGYFLHQQGGSKLWLQLVADGGQVKDFGLAAALVHADLAALAHIPLLCIDEIDYLRPLNPDHESPLHTRLLEFIRGLQGHAPLLVIGQRGVIESDVFYTLAELAQSEVAEWLADAQIPGTAEDVARLHVYTSGTPRLLELCLALHLSRPEDAQHEPFSRTLDQLPRAPALTPLWSQLKRRLLPLERELLATLALFRNPAPADVWSRVDADDDQGATTTATIAVALRTLLARRLIHQDGRGGIALLPALRQTIYDELSIEQRERLHQFAAQVRLTRGEYTAAAYHCWQGGQPDRAVEIWYQHRAEEIGRGQARTALTMFEQISQNQLSQVRSRELALVRAELYRMSGGMDQVVASLESTDWPSAELVSLEATVLWGDALEARGDPDGAAAKHAAGLAAIQRLLQQASRFHVRRGTIFLRRRSMKDAWYEASRAQYEVENLQGLIQEQMGHYDVARTHLQNALRTAEELGYTNGIAHTHFYLGILANHQMELAVATAHYEKAIGYYEEIGDRFQMEYVRSNLAAACIDGGQTAQGIQIASQALAFFQQMGNSAWIAQNATNLAEAYCNLGQLEQAQHHAHLVLDQEEPHHHPYALFTLGRVLRARKQLPEAELYFAQSRLLAEQNEDLYLLAYAWRALAEVLFDQAKHEPATQAIAEALRLFRQLAILPEVAETEKVLEKIKNDAFVIKSDA